MQLSTNCLVQTAGCSDVSSVSCKETGSARDIAAHKPIIINHGLYGSTSCCKSD